ncbi:5-formyltetrahydrofolate cyclo-ligase [Ornithinimicrobium murale]|uniref:5-formyltetrahydrofolate cyclo-ligase n=1 Tax=Ornithinimicrobium murale TaxID=1050153 RepID=UPI000E0D2953|nr:5-formyltetrahydrofolate cyclo-ligase [Ornithinimicrobium murale]
MDDVRAAKKQARSRVRARRRDLVERQGVAERAEQASALANAFLTWARGYAEGLGRGDLSGLVVTAFDPMPTEPPVHALVAAAREAGMRVLLPVTVREDTRLDWVTAGDPTSEVQGPEALLGVDIALIPGLAVDLSGHRLGQGGGYYDRALPLVRPGVPVVVALHDHEFPTHAAPELAVPHAPHDIPVDGVLTTAGVTRLPVG